ncbi:phosphate/phosphite/phosphonate ABC transporter substrate-binding protein [Pelobacter propionicus]|uniref:ABC-type phosphate/phosphonate transport system periplasmic component-like protein n=1 Tax=Pelobacter propionicus (strain DSM 2379 / NBRC 103807 / OttBd1) TaxID=338966 RepID=A1ANY4_PELPD|nr:PhnD/SsuA/transferrin family substrate-binding protein [Pelobacter propionicus]ABK99054.1 ABC-type phosphate/phosphonate transport system periplasmic component-like protein [Pelobacter propionicus DSM 2379]
MSRRDAPERASISRRLRLTALRLVPLLALVCILLLPLFASADGNDGIPAILRVGISSQLFPDLDHNDVRIAMGLWTREVARRIGVESQMQPVIFTRPAEMLEAVNRGELSVISLPALEYLQVRETAPLIPLIVSSSNNGRGKSFVLLTHRSSGISSLKQLGGKSIILPPSRNRASHLWLDVLMLREGKRDRNGFFRQVREGTRASQAIMAVFFRQADAVIVSRDALETSTALNPQMGSQLNVIAESDYLLDGVTCIPRNSSARYAAAFQQAALHLHENTVGKQILTLFQLERTMLFHPSQLAGVEELVRERKRLQARPIKRRQNR